MRRNQVYCVDYKDGMASLEDESIDLIVTSPPYWQARKYDGRSTIGFEKSPYEYVENLEPFLEESLRVLKPTGGLWLNIGDSRSQGKKRQRGRRDTDVGRKGKGFSGWSNWDGDTKTVEVNHNIPPKSFIGIPELVMLASLDIGFRVRNKIIWAKGAMRYDGASYGGTTPAPFKDNFAVCWEPVYYLTKDRFNYFNMDASQIPAKSGGFKAPLNVWVVPPSAGRERFSYKGQVNYATFPPALIDIIIKAGCPPKTCTHCKKPYPMLPDYKGFKKCTCKPMGVFVYERGLILDPFGGSGTTAISAIKNNMDYILFDISPEQVEYAKARIEYAKQG